MKAARRYLLLPIKKGAPRRMVRLGGYTAEIELAAASELGEQHGVQPFPDPGALPQDRCRSGGSTKSATTAQVGRRQLISQRALPNPSRSI